jgi:hypothetical protein
MSSEEKKLKLAEEEQFMVEASEASDAEEKKKKLAAEDIPPPQLAEKIVPPPQLAAQNIPPPVPDETQWDQVDRDENGNLLVKNRGTGEQRTLCVIPGSVPQFIWKKKLAAEDIPPPQLAEKIVPPPQLAAQNIPPPQMAAENIPPPQMAAENIPPPQLAEKIVPPPQLAAQNIPPPQMAAENIPPPPVPDETQWDQVDQDENGNLLVKNRGTGEQRTLCVIPGSVPQFIWLPLTAALSSQPSGSAPDNPSEGSNVVPIGNERITRKAILTSNPDTGLLILELLDRIKILEAKVTDSSRWIKKRHFVLTGNDVPNESKYKNPTSVFINMTKRKFGVQTSPSDYSMIHRLGKKTIIAEVVNRQCNSPFMRLMNAPDQNRNLDVKLSMKKDDEDWEIISKAQKLLNSGIISEYYTDNISGKIVVMKGGRYISIQDVHDLVNVE